MESAVNFGLPSLDSSLFSPIICAQKQGSITFFVNDPLFSEFFLSKQFANEYVNSTFSLSSSKPNKSKYLVENVH